MEGQYYPASMYGREYAQFGGMTYQHPSCVYGSKTPLGSYGAQTMNVVDQSCLGLPGDPNAAALGLNVSLHGASSPMTPHHYVSAHHYVTHPHTGLHARAHPAPPPAHQHNDLQKDKTPQRPPLHFPWMKTTKSHAHQWKANWPGMYASMWIPVVIGLYIGKW